jgi:hypothetical protein
MLRLNVNQEKQLTFEVQIGGVADYDKLESYFRITINEVGYVFPARVSSNSITVNLPPLNKVIGQQMREGDEAEIKLEVIADGHYLTPWSDRAKFSNPLVVEAKIKDNGFVANPHFQTTLKVEEDGAKHTTVISEKEIDPSDDIVNRVVEKLASKLALNKEQEEEDSAGDEEEVEEQVIKETKLRKKKVPKNIDNLVSEKFNKLFPSKKKSGRHGGMNLNEFKKALSKDDILRYMERSGTKNPKIQKVIYEQAELTAKGSNPIDVLKQVIKIVNRKKK